MVRTFKVVYQAVKKYDAIEIKAFSKYDAKQRFKRTYPQYEVVKVEEVTE
jgi:ribosomal protein L20A (L18A)